MKKSDKKSDLEAPHLYINRELSWLEFNDRVLREGMSTSVPLLERLKFLAIVSSNLDEFFMIRVAGLRQAAARGGRVDISGMPPKAQLSAIHERVARMLTEQAAAIADVTGQLVEHGLCLATSQTLLPEQKRFLRSHFNSHILPVLTPLGSAQLDPMPVLPGLKLYVALLLAPRKPIEGAPVEPHVAIVPVPGGLPPFITTPTAKGVCLARLEEVVAAHAEAVFPGSQVVTHTLFRITRDADVAVDEEDATELLDAVEAAILARRRRAVVRLTLSARPDPRLKSWLMQRFQVTDQEVYEVDGMLDPSALMQVAMRSGFEELKYPAWPPQPARDLAGRDDLWAVLQEQDVLLFHPYESFDPVVQMVSRAADDSNVLAIKQTLYRTSGDSPIIAALVRAAENGKQVTVLVELKARFDEARNVQWARRLEDAGCYVLYGIAGYKTHAKALLIVRREEHRIRRYLHLSTGNYNDRTARLYSDAGLMTADTDITADAAAFFNLLTGYSQPVGWNKISIAPTNMRQRFLRLIDREIQASTPDSPGLIMAKVNSLQDKRICRALYQASRAGVRVLLNIRGVCCLRPGIAGVSDNIEVTSIIDRYLEHARVFYFRNGGHEEVYMSSADWMVRNLDKRLELLFPVQKPELKKRLIACLTTFFADNVKARRLNSDGTYSPVKRKGEAVRAQEQFFHEALEAAKAESKSIQEFRPLTSPGA